MFKDRKEAANELVKELLKFEDKDAVVLAIPRGGVPLGAVISEALDCPLGIVLAKKIGHPANKEYAIGAVGPKTHSLAVQSDDISVEYIEEEIARLQQVLSEKTELWKDYVYNSELKDKVVIIVDDGIATGSTLLACIHMVSEYEPRQIIAAIPVAPKSVHQRLRYETNEVICLKWVDHFFSIGEHYLDFGQVKDKEVTRLLERSARRPGISDWRS